MNDHGPLERLNARLQEAEQRLSQLEQRLARLERAEQAAAAQPAAELQPAVTAPAPAPIPEPLPAQGGGMFPVLGRAMLGLAGAFLLRALAESGAAPRAAVEFAGVAYALLWMAAGARARSTLAATVYACTSVLILAPMLWELTVRFGGIPAAAGAGALAGFAAVAMAVARDTTPPAVLRIANISAAALCLTLAVASHANVPYLTVLLLLAGVCELTAVRGGLACGRPVIALAADLGVWLLIYLYRVPESARSDYAPLTSGWLIAPGFVLFAIFAAGIAVRCVRRQQQLGVFDAAQAMITFVLAATGLLFFGPAAKQGVLGAICLALAAALYATVLGWLRNQPGRNHEIFATWSVALLVAGVCLAFPAAAQPDCLSAAALAAMAAAALLSTVTLAVHATIFLLLSAWLSGLLLYVLHALAGSPAATPSVHALFTAVSAALAYALLQRRPRSLRHGQWFSVLFAAVAAVSVLALLVQAAAALAGVAFAVGPHHLALLRSLVLCAAALALAFSGTRWRRAELTQIGYAVVVLEALKLVLEDLRHGHLAYVAASVCLFALTLIAIPRVTRSRPPRHKVA